jgi:ABC-type multidrug transport system ATPase subunit
MVPPEVIALDAVERGYGDRPALCGVGFRVRSGEAVALLGPNGAGKTTTFRLLTGLVPPSAGSVRVFGADPFRQRAWALAHVGALVGNPGTLPYLRVSDLMEHVCRIRGVPRDQVPGEVRRTTGDMGVTGLLARPMGSLSTGQERRVLLSAALVGDPELLLLDEPTLGLDPVSRGDLRRLLGDLIHAGHTLLIATHLVEDVQPLCTRVLFLKDGRLAGDEPVGRGPGADLGLGLRFRGEVPVEDLRRVLAPFRATLVSHDSATAVVRFPGSEETQVAVLRALIASGLPLLEVGRPPDDLTQRYLERIGREEELPYGR